MPIAIDLNLIFPSFNARPVDKGRVKELADSISDVGMLNPICVRKVVRHRGTTPYDAFAIVAGHHRYEAARLLRWSAIPAHVVEMDDLHAELAEIDENLVRSSLTPAQEASAIFRRKQIYEELHPETKQHVAGAHAANKAMGRDASDNLSFASSTADATGKDKRTIERAAARGEALGSDLDAVAGTSLDKGVELDALVKMAPEERAPIIERAKAGEKVSARTHDVVYLEQAADLKEAEKRNGTANRVVEMSAAEQFAQWILARSDLGELDTVMSWLRAVKPKDVIAALAREAA